MDERFYRSLFFYNNHKMTDQNFDHKESKYWKWGLFYYNKQDKRIFPPKRQEWMGWTVNFANPKSILAFLIFFVLILSFVYFITFNS